MVSVRIDAESPEEIATLLRGLMAETEEASLDGDPKDPEERCESIKRHERNGAALETKAWMGYRAAKRRLDEIRESESTRDSDAERRDTSA